MTRAVVTLMVFVLVGEASVAQFPTRHVFKIRVGGSSHSKETIVQTGFRLQGTKGIITALHGVLDGKTLSAANDSGQSFVDLKLQKVDISNDLALLSSAEIQAQPAEGFEAGGVESLIPGQILHVLGSPQAIDVYDKRVLAGNPVSRKLSKMIPPSSARAFVERKSPSEHIDVLNIDGALVPGHSGAPVLDPQYRVLGVVDGGIVGADICWAIPVSGIIWKSIRDVQSKINELTAVDPRELFAFNTEGRTEPWHINVSGLAAGKDLNQVSAHLGVDHPVTYFGIDGTFGCEAGYARRIETSMFPTIPGMSDAVLEQKKQFWYFSLCGGIMPVDWEWFSPSIEILVGLPLNFQAVLKVRILRVSIMTILGEWRTMVYGEDSYTVRFNPYGDALQEKKGETIVQWGLGVCLTFEVDFPWGNN